MSAPVVVEDDIFDQVKAPSWAENLQFENDNYEDLDDDFFPVAQEIEKVTLQIEELELEKKEPEENPEDLSRMAMFGHKTQVKRRSQIRKEQEMKKTSPPAVTAPAPRASSIPRPVSRSSSITRAPSLTRTTSTTSAPAPRPSGPVTRSQTRAMSSTTPAHPERRGRDMTRNATAVQRRGASPAPNQMDFALALTQRPGSLGGDANRRTGFGTSTPVAQRNVAPRNNSATRPLGVPSHRVPPRTSSVTRNSAANTSKTTAPAATSRPNPLARVRAPVAVTKSPGAPAIAFGSAVKPKPQVPRTSAIRPRQETQQATPNPRIISRAAPLRVYPTPSGQTPVRNLTLPKTPVVAKRTSSLTRNGTQTPVAPVPNTAERRVLKAKDIQGMVDRLSKPKNVTSIQRPATAATPRRTIPNTYTHGMTAGVKVRSRSNSRPTSQTNSRSTSCTRDENIPVN